MGLDRIDLFLRVEREFKIALPDAVAADIITIEQLYEAVSEALRLQGRPVDPEVIWEHMATLISHELGVRRKEIVPGMKFYEDLNCGWKVPGDE